MYNHNVDEDVVQWKQHKKVMTANNSNETPFQNITAVILAGGRARRMGGEDKGLIELAGRPMIEHIIDAVRPQVKTLIINANRNLAYYQQLGYPVVEDMMGDYFGPLVGMASALRITGTDYLLTVPCDSPFVPTHLAERLYQALEREQAEISVVHDGTRMQPVFALLKRHLLPNLIEYLENGGRKIDIWYAQHRLALADFSSDVDCFLNVNTPDERNALEKRLKHGSAHG
jgi:molybdenum cofactor guanylyltransferase